MVAPVALLSTALQVGQIPGWGGKCRSEWGMCEVVWVSLWAPIQGSRDECVGGHGGGQAEGVGECPYGAA